ncbi:restriction endonuclease (plasmid) [Leuconostoc gasicomitatum]|nr:BstXI family restriction endonuclease [Leuconostoc gasicomitatum]QFS15932.1 restriction endonuclease [Leuconostoc gasicomitatum]
MDRVNEPKLPQLLDRKIYKTGQTRGADDSQIYQNRVGRNSVVLIPYREWLMHEEIPTKALNNEFEKGYVVLIDPADYFSHDDIDSRLILGRNMLVFYQLRSDWENNNPVQYGWQEPIIRAENPIINLGGQYVARIAATTAIDGTRSAKIYKGYTGGSAGKGAGIRLYEYADTETIKSVRVQLEFIFWKTRDAGEVMRAAGMTDLDIQKRREWNSTAAISQNLVDELKFQEARIINEHGITTCPLCLEEISASGFITRMAQAEGREVHDLTITENNLFHIRELQFNEYNHKLYNLGWGHHHCNVVVKDAGIFETLNWMRLVLANNNMLNS